MSPIETTSPHSSSSSSDTPPVDMTTPLLTMTAPQPTVSHESWVYGSITETTNPSLSQHNGLSAVENILLSHPSTITSAPSARTLLTSANADSSNASDAMSVLATIAQSAGLTQITSSSSVSTVYPCTSVANPLSVLSPDPAVNPDSLAPSPAHTNPSPTSSAAQSPSSTVQDDNPPAPTLGLTVKLPPCRVCGRRATGFHYGVESCEACKCFFRRCLIRKTPYKCQGTSTCSITPKSTSSLDQQQAPGSQYTTLDTPASSPGTAERRPGTYKVSRGSSKPYVPCSACRYKRCIDVGMSKDAARAGRYTLEMITKSIQEVKNLEAQLKLNQDGSLVTNDSYKQLSTERLLGKLRAVTVDTGILSFPDFPAVYEQEERYMSSQSLHSDLYGISSVLSVSEHGAVYEETGLDVDGRMSWVAGMVEGVEKKYDEFEAFCEALPGVDLLCEEDKRLITKEGGLDRWVFMNCSWFNVQDGVMTYPLQHPQLLQGQGCQKDSVSRSLIFSKENMRVFTERDTDRDKHWAMILRIQQLDLTPDETLIAAGIALLCAALCADTSLTPSGSRVITSSVEHLVDLYTELLSQSHPRAGVVVANTLAIITELRELRDLHRDYRASFRRYCKQMGQPEAVQKKCFNDQ